MLIVNSSGDNSDDTKTYHEKRGCEKGTPALAEVVELATGNNTAVK